MNGSYNFHSSKLLSSIFYLLFSISCLIIFLPPTLSAQSRFAHFNLEQGLSQSSVYAILQDRHGFMWFGTQSGLNKFDGYRFTVYNQEPQQNPYSLSSGSVHCLYEDSNGKIWVGTEGGINVFDPETGRFTVYRHDSLNINSPSGDYIRTITGDRKGNIWFGTKRGGLDEFNPQTGKFTIYQHDPEKNNSISSNDVICLCEDRRGRILVGTNGEGMNIFNQVTKHFKVFRHDANNPASISFDVIRGIVEDSAGTVWIGTKGGGLNAFNPNSEKFTVYRNDPNNPNSLSFDVINCLHHDRNDNIWIGTWGDGVNRFNPKTRMFTVFRHDERNPQSLENDQVFSIYEDRSGSVWIGTNGSGLNLFNSINERFTIYQHDANKRNSISGNTINCIYRDSADNFLWLGTDNEGLNKIDLLTGNVTKYMHNPDDPKSISHNSITSIIKDRSGTLWVGTYGGGLNSRKQSAKTFEVSRQSSTYINSISSDKIRCVIEDHAGMLWIGTAGGGLNEFKLNTGRIRSYMNDPEEHQSLSHNDVACVYEDSEGNIWIGTDGGGLNLLDRLNGKFKVYKHDVKNANSLCNDNIMSILEDEKGIIWLGTWGGGVQAFNPLTYKFTGFTDLDGLPDNFICGMLQDRNGNLWLSTNKGLCRFTWGGERGTGKGGRVKRGLTIRNYNLSDGLPSNEFNTGACFKAYDGKMYFGTIAGVVSFYPDSLKDNPFLPPVAITDFQVFNKSIAPGDSSGILEHPISETKELNFPYKLNVFSFEFSALNFINPEKNKYAYKMEGFDKDWNYTGAHRRFSTYTNLEPGHYVFRVKASNNDGVWNEQGAAIKIHITPPFWQIWWFKALTVIILFSIIYFIYRSRLNLIKKEEERKTEMNKRISEIRLVALRSQMNPHFIFNSLNSIQQFIHSNASDQAIKYLSKFSKLIRQILENSNESTILLIDEIKMMELYLELESMRFENKFYFSITVDEEIDEENTEIPSMLIQPFIENAIIHGLMSKKGKGHIWITLKQGENCLLCSIEDNGIGRAKAMQIKQKKISQHKSMGLSVTTDRLTILNQYKDREVVVDIEDLMDSNDQPSGTRVELIIPVE